MRIAHLIPGTCEVFYCENCLRDFDLTGALRRTGHEVEVVPLYLPLTAEDGGRPGESPIFFGGVNTYLQEKSALFRHLPRWLARSLDARWLLRLASHKASLTSPEDLGETTCSMLRGEHGHQARELERLVAWLAAEWRPDIVLLANVLLVGLARRIREELRVPVACQLEDEDGFLDTLPEPYRREAWDAVATRARELDGFIAVSRSYGDAMRDRLDLQPERIAVVHNGIDLSGYGSAPDPPDPPAIGFLSPALPEKGLALLIDAFAILKAKDRWRQVALRVSGGTTAGSHPFLEDVHERIRAASLAGAVEFLPNLSRPRRREFLRALSVLSVPTTRPHAFGMYVLEALACGVPVVEPRHGAFPEILEATAGGILVEPNDPGALAGAIEDLLADPAKARALGESGRQNVLSRYGIDRSAREIAEVLEKWANARRSSVSSA